MRKLGLALAWLMGLTLPMGLARNAAAQGEHPPAHVVAEPGHHGMAEETSPQGEPDGEEEAGTHGDHAPQWDDINWFTGMLGESDEEEPGLLWRPKGTPAPLGALIINTAIVFYLIGRFGKKPLGEALTKRRTNLLRGIEEASQMRAKARERLAEYEEKLGHVDQEIERLRQELREQARTERERVLSEARARGERLERDARVTVEQELKAARDVLLAESVRQAVGRARQLMSLQVSVVDQQRLLDEYLGNVAGGGLGGLS